MGNSIIPAYPEFEEMTPGMRDLLNPLFRGLKEGVSEFTFANIYLFRDTHGYRVSALGEGLYAISGIEKGVDFFMLPFGLPGEGVLAGLFKRFSFMKNSTETQALTLAGMGYRAAEDRDNFDYVYLRSELASLSGRRFHSKKNLVNRFLAEHAHESRPLLEEYIGDALHVLEEWRKEKGDGDYTAAREALEMCGFLGLCGGVYYAGGRPVAYSLGEELKEDTFVIHFEKALGGYRGLTQYVNWDFTRRLPAKYVYINREQDLGDEGLRKAKMSYRPAGFVRKYRVYAD